MYTICIVDPKLIIIISVHKYTICIVDPKLVM